MRPPLAMVTYTSVSSPTMPRGTRIVPSNGASFGRVPGSVLGWVRAVMICLPPAARHAQEMALAHRLPARQPLLPAAEIANPRPPHLDLATVVAELANRRAPALERFKVNWNRSQVATAARR